MLEQVLIRSDMDTYANLKIDVWIKMGDQYIFIGLIDQLPFVWWLRLLSMIWIAVICKDMACTYTPDLFNMYVSARGYWEQQHVIVSFIVSSI